MSGLSVLDSMLTGDRPDGENPHDPRNGLFFHLYSSPPSGGVRWRLLGANNRELGRSCLAYPDIDLCRAGLATTLLELTLLVPAVMRVDRGHWGWRLRADGRDVVGSAHAFDRRPSCQAACARFIEQAPHASVRDTLTVMPWGSRNMRPSILRWRPVPLAVPLRTRAQRPPGRRSGDLRPRDCGTVRTVGFDAHEQRVVRVVRSDAQ